LKKFAEQLNEQLLTLPWPSNQFIWRMPKATVSLGSQEAHLQKASAISPESSRA